VYQKKFVCLLQKGALIVSLMGNIFQSNLQADIATNMTAKSLRRILGDLQ